MDGLPDDLAAIATLARTRLPRAIWDFAAGGSGEERTLAANREALDRVTLTPRVLAGAVPDTTTSLLGSVVEVPLATAPMAYLRLFHPDGELGMAAAARQAGVPFTTGILSSHPVEEIKPGIGWFQLYWLRDRGTMLELVHRAEESGCTALVVTVDMPVMATRRRDMQNRFTLPGEVTAANFRARKDNAVTVAEGTNATFDPVIGWDDLDWLRAVTRLPIALKGVLDPRDAVRAVDAGVDAVVVSNHGGRQLDGAIPAISALPEVAGAVDGQAQVFLDSGVRSGLDVLRALALGADGVLVGRPLLWGLAAGGAAGARHVLALLATELREVMALAGCADVSSCCDVRARTL